MRNVNELYELWREKAVADPDLAAELDLIAGDGEQIGDRFYRDLSFGTAGLRGVLGAGTNRMNVYTVGGATQGLADYLNSEFDSPSVVIGFDSRINSRLFAETAASVLAANGVTVYYYNDIVPTPLVSYGVRRFKASSGIVITASHNPAEYNGYKCYDHRGYQMTDEAAAKTYEFIKKTDVFDGVKRVDFAAAVNSGAVRLITSDVRTGFLEEVLKTRITPDAPAKADLKIMYTPLNGTGNLFVRDILRMSGHKNVKVVASQKLADGSFPTCPYPNPEIRQVFEEGLKLTADFPADLIIATDPDADRMGIAVRDGAGEYKLMTGNEVGIMLTEYILRGLKAAGRLPEKAVVLKSLVSCDLVADIAAAYGAVCEDLLTGFKYIGEYITELESKGQADRFVLGFEESYGYLRGVHARDKDAVVASMLVAEMAAWAKLEGMDLLGYLQSIYAKYGFCGNSLANYKFPGAAGMEQMAGIMAHLREKAPADLGGLKVVSVADYETGEITDTATGEKTKLGYPASDVLIYTVEGGSKVVVRPSGTEPKLKIYISAKCPDKASADELSASLAKDAQAAAGI